MTTLEMILTLSLFAAVVGLIAGRRSRNYLRADLANAEIKIAGLNSENMDLADALRRYRGAWEALGPKEGEIYITRVIRPPVTLDDHIIDMIRKAGGC